MPHFRALTEKGDVMICDHNLHASLVEGALAVAGAHRAFPAQRYGALRALPGELPARGKDLHRLAKASSAWKATSPTCAGIMKLAKPYGARIYVDEAHGIGVLGPTGAGAAEHLGVLDDVDIVMGTFSKSLASVGGFIAAERAVVDYLKHTARPFVFSASLPAASRGRRRAALQIMRKEPERRTAPAAHRPAAAR